MAAMAQTRAADSRIDDRRRTHAGIDTVVLEAAIG
jgi:hypothetical protein